MRAIGVAPEVTEKGLEAATKNGRIILEEFLGYSEANMEVLLEDGLTCYEWRRSAEDGCFLLQESFIKTQSDQKCIPRDSLIRLRWCVAGGFDPEAAERFVGSHERLAAL